MQQVQIGEAPTFSRSAKVANSSAARSPNRRKATASETYGRVVGITRQVLINDDLDAFTRIPAMYGTAIATLESDVVWGIVTANANMADGVPLFHATHKNLASPAGVPSVTAIGDGRTAMAKQTGLDKKTVLNVRPPRLSAGARRTPNSRPSRSSQNVVPAKTGDVVPQSIRTLTPIAEPRLDLASATAVSRRQSGADHYDRVRLSRRPAGSLHRDPQRLRCRRRRDQVPSRFRGEGDRWRGLFRKPRRLIFEHARIFTNISEPVPKNYVQPGRTITLAAPYAVASGDGLLVGAIFGIATASAILAEQVEACLVGVFDLKAHRLVMRRPATKSIGTTPARRPPRRSEPTR